MVYLSSSKISLAVLGNMGFALALATYKLLLRVRRRCRRRHRPSLLQGWLVAAAWRVTPLAAPRAMQRGRRAAGQGRSAPLAHALEAGRRCRGKERAHQTLPADRCGLVC